MLSAAGLEFVTDRHLATLTTIRPDGTPHVTPVGFTWDAATATARVICSGTSRKARNAEAGGPAVLCQFEGRHWLAFEGTASVRTDAAAVADAEGRYAARYRPPRPNPARVVIEIAVHRVLGTAALLA